MSRSGALPAVKIQVPDGLSHDDVAKALRKTADRLEQPKSNPLENFARMNPAAKKLVEFVEESFRLATESMVREMKKVLSETETHS